MTRDALVRVLLEHDLAAGNGDAVQVAAWREIEWRRCAADPAYFIEKYGYLISKTGDITRWNLWPKQRQLLADLHAGHSIVAIKARQLGVTTLLINFRLWQVIFKDAVRNHFVSDSEEKGKEAMTKMGATYDRLPAWMKERAVSKAKVSADKRKDRKEGTMGVAFGLSELKVLTSTPNSVAGVSGNIDLDEFGRHRDQTRIINNAIPAFLGGAQMCIVGNGNGKDELYRVYQRAIAGEFPGMRAYFFSWRDDITRVTGENAPYLIDEGVDGFSVPEDERVYYTEGEPVPTGKYAFYPWYEDTKKMYLREEKAQDIYAFKAQFPDTVEEAWTLTGNSFFNMHMVNGYSRLTRDFKRAECRQLPNAEDGNECFYFTEQHNGRLRLYHEPEPDGFYVMGVDPVTGGANGDYAVATVCRLLNTDALCDAKAEEYGHHNPPLLDGKVAFEYEPTNNALEVCAVYQARTEPVGFAVEVENLARHYNQAFVVIESNASGGTVISHIKSTYTNLYRQIRKDTKFNDEMGDVIGYWETERSKRQMLDDLNWWLAHGWVFVNDSATVSELAVFGYDERGKLKAPKGMHDDLVFGLGLCVVGARDLMMAPTDDELVNFGSEW